MKRKLFGNLPAQLFFAILSAISMNYPAANCEVVHWNIPSSPLQLMDKKD